MDGILNRILGSFASDGNAYLAIVCIVIFISVSSGGAPRQLAGDFMHCVPW